MTENVAGLLSTHTTMGLFSSVIHVRDATGEAVCKALKNSVPNWPFRVSEQHTMTGAPHSAPEDTLLYMVSPLYGSWSTIVEGHFAVKDAPWLSDLAKCLSGALATYVLALMVHDDDVLYYDLCQDGANLDGYNSDPQYFETARLSEESIAEQRHNPRAFAPLLPDSASMAELQAILDRGWWSAWKGERLDADGVPPEDEPCFVFEGDRMAAIGDLLRLHGGGEGYPFAAWAEAPGIRWPEFQELRFQRA